MDSDTRHRWCAGVGGALINLVVPWREVRYLGSYVLIHTGPSDEKGMPQDKAFINGGLMPRDPSASSPVLVIAVEDADAAVEKIKKSGGKLVGEILDIPNVGRYARVQDTEGNVIGVIKPFMA